MSLESKYFDLLGWGQRIIIGADHVSSILSNHEITFLEKFILIVIVNETHFTDNDSNQTTRDIFEKYFQSNPKELDKALINLKNKKLLDYCGKVRQASYIQIPFHGFKMY